MVRDIVFRRMLVGNAFVSATWWKRVSAVSGPVLRSTPGGPHLPPQPPFLSHAAGEEGGDYAPHLPPSPCRLH